MRLITLCLAGFTAILPLVSGESPVPDCLTPGPGSKDQAPFFLCLNVRREGCEELLRKMQAECGAGISQVQGRLRALPGAADPGQPPDRLGRI